MSRSELASFLRQLAERVESGTVVLTNGGQETTVEVSERVELEVEYETREKAKGTRYQLEIEIEWGPDTGGI